MKFLINRITTTTLAGLLLWTSQSGASTVASDSTVGNGGDDIRLAIISAGNSIFDRLENTEVGQRITQAFNDAFSDAPKMDLISFRKLLDVNNFIVTSETLFDNTKSVVAAIYVSSEGKIRLNDKKWESIILGDRAHFETLVLHEIFRLAHVYDDNYEASKAVLLPLDGDVYGTGIVTIALRLPRKIRINDDMFNCRKMHLGYFNQLVSTEDMQIIAGNCQTFSEGANKGKIGYTIDETFYLKLTPSQSRDYKKYSADPVKYAELGNEYIDQKFTLPTFLCAFVNGGCVETSQTLRPGGSGIDFSFVHEPVHYGDFTTKVTISARVMLRFKDLVKLNK